MEHHHTNPTPVHHQQQQQQISTSDVKTLSAAPASSNTSTFLSTSSAASVLKRPLEDADQERCWKRRRHSVMDEMSINSSNTSSTNTRSPSLDASTTSPPSSPPETSTTNANFEQTVVGPTTPLPKPRARALSEPSHSTVLKTRHLDIQAKRLQGSTVSCRKSSNTQKTRRGSHDRPPVNLSTLRELDLKEILNNPRLRHDIYFDAALHFRPNLDGQRGQKKRAQANVYWDAIAKECEMVRKNQHSLQRGSTSRLQPKKLIVLFETMRDILLSLVPAKDQRTVEQVFDQSLLMQQLEYGLLDFKRLAEWLARLLKAHCAPMRDSWVDDMVAKIVDGVDTENTRLLVDGLRSVFGILEAMKLDVANHQIRTLRPFLVSSAAEFEREHFQKRVAKGGFAIDEPQEWFQRVVVTYSIDEKCQDFQDYLTRGVMDILTPTNSSLPLKPPATFTFDFERLEAIKVDIREDTCMKICLLLFRQLVLTTKCKKDISEDTTNELTATLQAIMGEEDISERWEKHSAAVALQIAQFATSFSQGKSTTAVYPSASMVRMAETWLATHTRLDSKIYKMVETTIVNSITERTGAILKAWSVHKTPTLNNLASSVMGLSTEFAAVPQRLAKILNLHWRIFETMYLSSAQLLQLQSAQKQKQKSSATSPSDEQVKAVDAEVSSSTQPSNELIHALSNTSIERS